MGERDLDKARDDYENAQGLLTAGDLEIFAPVPTKIEAATVSSPQDQTTGAEVPKRSGGDSPAGTVVDATAHAAPGDGSTELPAADSNKVASYQDQAESLARHVAGGNDISNGMGSIKIKALLQSATESGPEAVASVVAAINKALKGNTNSEDMVIDAEYLTPGLSGSGVQFTLKRTGKDPDKHTCNPSQRSSNPRLRGR